MSSEFNKDEINVLLCVAKARQSLGRSMISEVLRGSHSVRVFSRRLYINSTFATMKGKSEEEVDALIQDLINRGLLEESSDESPQLALTEESKRILHEYADQYAD